MIKISFALFAWVIFCVSFRAGEYGRAQARIPGEPASERQKLFSTT